MPEKGTTQKYDHLLHKIEELKTRLSESEDALNAIRNGDVDAIIVSGSDGQKVFSLTNADTNYRILLEEMNEGAMTVNSEGNVLYCNQRFADLIDRHVSEIIGSRCIDIISEGEKEKFRELVKKTCKDQTSGLFSFGNVTNSSSRYLQLSFRLLPSEISGSISIIASDVTEMKQYQEHLEELVKERTLLNEELLRSNKELENFAYVASHDLQEPLRMVTSFTQLLEMQYRDKLDDNAKEYIHFAVDGAKRMYELLNGLLAYSRIHRKGEAFILVDLNRIIDAVIENLELMIKEREAIIKSEKLPEVYADESQMIILFQNLISNSLKFSPNPPRIFISSKSEGDNFTFYVKDEGIGIEPQYFERIFLIFQRLNPRDNYEGTGIGLAICKRIVERHEGKIWLESEFGKGTTFYFSIPKQQNIK